MSYIAYKDKNKTELITADVALENKNYYCPFPTCNAILTLCANGSTKIAPYFSAKKEKHIKNCPYSNSTLNIKLHINRNFSLEEFFL